MGKLLVHSGHLSEGLTNSEWRGISLSSWRLGGAFATYWLRDRAVDYAVGAVPNCPTVCTHRLCRVCARESPRLLCFQHSDRTGGFHGLRNLRASELVQWLLTLWATAALRDPSFRVSSQNENSRTIYSWTGDGLFSKRLSLSLFFFPTWKSSASFLCVGEKKQLIWMLSLILN